MKLVDDDDDDDEIWPAAIMCHDALWVVGGRGMW